jgi:CheY-like chemotaxis protein
MGCVDRSPARTVDFAGFLPKPIKQSVLASFLSSLINMEVQPQQQQGYNLRKQQQTLMKVDMSVLVADDNPINTKVALRMLERRGYAADVAYNGVEAVRMYEKKKYDCILMDMQMPEMDGLEATRVLRSRWPGVGRPWIIAVTANAMCEDRDRCLAAGMDDYLSKPLDVSTLEQALLRCPAHPLRRIRDSNANSDKSC